MENVFVQSGGKAINLLSKHIFRTQLALSFFYFCIVAAILGISSQTTRSIFLHRVNPRFDMRIESTHTLSAREIQQDLYEAMLMVNGVLLICAGFIGYFLAGITLKPLQESYQKEQQFLHDASHELRTPLAILRTSLENIERKGDSALQETAKDALEEVDRMHHLLQNILLLSRNERYRAKQQLVSAQEIAEKSIDRMQVLAKQHQCTLNIKKDTEDFSLLGNQEELERMLINVLHNALSYNNPNGNVTLSLKKNRSHGIFIIEDNGIGMSEEEIQHLTQRFYRVEKSRARSTGGSGLGLAIVQQIVENHKGNLSFASTPRKGTTVRIEFPIHNAS